MHHPGMVIISETDSKNTSNHENGNIPITLFLCPEPLSLKNRIFLIKAIVPSCSHGGGHFGQFTVEKTYAGRRNA